MIFVVFLVPLALYLLLLGHLNRQPRPVFVSGTVDFIGILFAASGFLMFGGPAIVTSLSEGWRSFWLTGDQRVSRDSLLAQWQFWVILLAFYYVAVVIGCAIGFARRKATTSIYNVDPGAVEGAIEECCDQLGLSPIRSGNVFVFGPGLEALPGSGGNSEGIQAPHLLLERGKKPTHRLDAPPSFADEFVGQSAVLEVETFDLMRHATLRWDPSDSPLRGVLEAELERRLAQAGAPYHETGLWLTLSGYALLGVALGAALLLMAVSVFVR